MYIFDANCDSHVIYIYIYIYTHQIFVSQSRLLSAPLPTVLLVVQYGKPISWIKKLFSPNIPWQKCSKAVDDFRAAASETTSGPFGAIRGQQNSASGPRSPGGPFCNLNSELRFWEPLFSLAEWMAQKKVRTVCLPQKWSSQKV